MSEKQFRGQRKGEEVVFIFRKHIITIWKSLFFFILMISIGIVLLIFFKDINWMFLVFLGLFMFGLFVFLRKYIYWYFSVYIVTDERIRQVSQTGLFRKTVVDLGLDKIQTVSYAVPGLFGGMFGYGTLLIQTHVGDMQIKKVSKPEKVYEQLQELRGGI